MRLLRVEKLRKRPVLLDVLHHRLNEAAADAVRQRWRMIHPNEDYPPIIPEHFEIEALEEFSLSGIAPGFGPFTTLIGARAYITRFPSGLAF
jgi:hypothetical protein